MPHGQADYGMYTQKKTTFGLSDMGELAARLGSPVTYDRRGDVIFYEDFENEITNWKDDGDGLGHDRDLDAFLSRSGAFSCKLTTGSNLLLRGGILTYELPPVRSKVGLEVHFTKPWLNWEGIEFRLKVTHPDKSWDGRIRVNDLPPRLVYWDGTDWQTIDENITGTASYYHFFPLKFVFDLENDVYSRVLLLNREFDLSSITLPTGAGATVNESLISVHSFGDAGFNVSNWVDDIILTQNEP